MKILKFIFKTIVGTILVSTTVMLLIVGVTAWTVKNTNHTTFVNKQQLQNSTTKTKMGFTSFIYITSCKSPETIQVKNALWKYLTKDTYWEFNGKLTYKGISVIIVRVKDSIINESFKLSFPTSGNLELLNKVSNLKVGEQVKVKVHLTSRNISCMLSTPGELLDIF